jgi:hypothetical protein
MHSHSLLQTILSLAATIHLASTTPSTITTPPRALLPRQTSSPSSSTFDANVAACSSYSSLSNSCAAASPPFGALPFSSEASCLCYTDVSTYAPSIYDGYWGSCLNYYQTASPEYFSQTLSGNTLTRTPCAAAGNVLGTAAATGVVSVVVVGSSSSVPTTGSGAASSPASTGTSSGAASVEKGGVFLVLTGLVALVAVL